jgi:hypothetical protein
MRLSSRSRKQLRAIHTKDIKHHIDCKLNYYALLIY